MTVEPRGPAVLLAGLCVECGVATVRRAGDGLARHEGCDTPHQ